MNLWLDRLPAILTLTGAIVWPLWLLFAIIVTVATVYSLTHHEPT